ncbi:adipokinetic hormone/corazonin-related peptide-like [Diprion similis]|uniref:adipokinetic hormone/corazonin-related peptide-like n=1 Tax=Diprion similis TaxID=362088 RepID=UPI001EF863FD|nr:adipokinetic hormone/corazonin-related peptide-like [Diprion similis]
MIRECEYLTDAGEKASAQSGGTRGLRDDPEIYKARILRLRSDELRHLKRSLKRYLNSLIFSISTMNGMLRQDIMRGFSLCYMFFLVLVCYTRIGSGQVTFSRDWNPGKRSPSSEGSCLTNAKALAAACHALMSELKKLSACQTRTVVQLLRSQDDGVHSDQAVLFGRR